MMATGIRVIKNPGRIDDDCPDQSMIRKQSKCIVDSRLRYQVVFAIDQMHDLVGRQVLLTLEQYACNVETLLGWQYAMALQQFLDVVTTKWLFVSLIHHGVSIVPVSAPRLFQRNAWIAITAFDRHLDW
jgi:hypothetical protein